MSDRPAGALSDREFDWGGGRRTGFPLQYRPRSIPRRIQPSGTGHDL